MQRFILYILLVISFGSLDSFAQGADGLPPFAKDDENMTKSFRESRVKMRIDREKKDHEEMLERGEDPADSHQPLTR